MRVAVVGLARSGKTTLFNAVTRGNAPVGAFGGGYGGAAPAPNVGAARIEDPRLDALASLFGSRRQVPAEAAFVDVPSAPDDAQAQGLFDGPSVNHVQDADALLIVTRAFEDPSLPHPDGSVDAARDAETVLLELALADGALVKRRIARIEEGLEGREAGRAGRVQRRTRAAGTARRRA